MEANRIESLCDLLRAEFGERFTVWERYAKKQIEFIRDEGLITRLTFDYTEMLIKKHGLERAADIIKDSVYDAHKNKLFGSQWET